MAALELAPWPGNVRQPRAVVRWACTQAAEADEIAAQPDGALGREAAGSAVAAVAGGRPGDGGVASRWCRICVGGCACSRSVSQRLLSRRRTSRHLAGSWRTRDIRARQSNIVDEPSPLLAHEADAETTPGRSGGRPGGGHPRGVPAVGRPRVRRGDLGRAQRVAGRVVGPVAGESSPTLTVLFRVIVRPVMRLKGHRGRCPLVPCEVAMKRA